MRRYFEIYGIMLRNSVIREMNFKANFLLWMAVEFLWFLGQILFIEVLFQYVDRIGDWTKWEVVLLMGTHQLIGQIFQAFFYLNIANLPELVRTGKLDFFLAQPASPQFLVSTRKFEPGSVVSCGVAIIVCLVAIAHLPTRLSWLGLAIYPALVGLGVLIHYAMMLMLMSLSFWMTRAQGFINAYYSIFQISRLPREAFFGFTKLLFTWAIPLLLIANVPARTLFAGVQWGDLFGLLAVTVVLCGLSRQVFQAGLRRYGSASS